GGAWVRPWGARGGGEWSEGREWPVFVGGRGAVIFGVAGGGAVTTALGAATGDQFVHHHAQGPPRGGCFASTLDDLGGRVGLGDGHTPVDAAHGGPYRSTEVGERDHRWIQGAHQEVLGLDVGVVVLQFLLPVPEALGDCGHDGTGVLVVERGLIDDLAQGAQGEVFLGLPGQVLAPGTGGAAVSVDGGGVR